MKLLYLNLKQALRNLRRQAWQAGISIAGLAFGIVCLTCSLNWLWTETHHDAFRPGYKQLYVLQTQDSARCNSHFPYNLQPQIDSVLRGIASVGTFQTTGKMKFLHAETEQELGPRSEKSNLSPEAVRQLGIRVLAGSIEEVMTTPGRIALSQTIARQFFGEENPIGKSIKLKDWIYASKPQTVAAIVDDMQGPANVPTNVISGMEGNYGQHDWRSWNYQLLIRTDNPGLTLERLNHMPLPKELYEFLKSSHFRLTPLRTYHKLQQDDPFWQAYFYPLAFLCISILLCIGAAFNLIAVYTSIFLSRLREYMLRMSLGALWRQNAGWLLTETGLVVGMALLLGGIGTEWTAYAFPDLPGGKEHLFIAFLWSAGLCSLLCLLLMAYPLLRIHRSYRRSFSGRSVGQPHTWLLCIQCFVCALLLFVSLGMQGMLKNMATADTGFRRENILRLQTGGYWSADDAEVAAHFSDLFHLIPDEFRKEKAAGIEEVVGMRSDIFNRETRHSFSVEDRHGRIGGEASLAFIELPGSAFRFFGFQLKEGSFPEENIISNRPMQVLLNEKAMQTFHIPRIGTEGYRSGERAASSNSMMISIAEEHILHRPMQICGVMQLRLTDFHSEEEPLALIPVPEDHKCYYVENDAIYVKHAPGRRQEAETAMRRVLKRMGVNEQLIRIQSLDEYVWKSYKDELFYARLLSILSVCSLFVTLSGVFSMLLYSLRLRRRSLAIRRVMGADFGDLMKKTLRPYLLLVALSALAAYPFGAYLMHKWMEYFTYGKQVSPWLMVGIAALILALVTLIIYFQLRRLMREKPIDILRPEA